MWSNHPFQPSLLIGINAEVTDGLELELVVLVMHAMLEVFTILKYAMMIDVHRLKTSFSICLVPTHW